MAVTEFLIQEKFSTTLEAIMAALPKHIENKHGGEIKQDYFRCGYFLKTCGI